MNHVARKPEKKSGHAGAMLALRRERDLLRLLVDTAPAMVTYLDAEQRYVYCNRPYCDAFGVHYKKVVGRGAREVLGDDLYHATQQHIRRVLAGHSVRYERVHRWPDGRAADIAVNLVPHTGAGGRVLGFIAVLVDVTERKFAEGALRESESRLRTIADHLPALVAYVDTREIYHFANSTYQEWLGRSREQVIGHSMRQVLGPRAYAVARPHIRTALDGETAVHERELMRGGKHHHLHNVYVPHFGERREVLGFFILATDISDRKALEAHLSRIAQHDSLTGLPNRILLEDRLQRAMERSKRRRQPVALMYLDIDRFKDVNDTLGHNTGDELLKAFSGRIRQCVRASDTVARLGGDEFVILLEDLGQAEDALLVAQKIVASMQQRFELPGAVIPVTASIGLALGHGGEFSGADLLARADAALYEAKAGGRNTYRLAA